MQVNCRCQPRCEGAILSGKIFVIEALIFKDLQQFLGGGWHALILPGNVRLGRSLLPLWRSYKHTWPAFGVLKLGVYAIAVYNGAIEIKHLSNNCVTSTSNKVIINISFQCLSIIEENTREIWRWLTKRRQTWRTARHNRPIVYSLPIPNSSPLSSGTSIVI